MTNDACAGELAVDRRRELVRPEAERALAALVGDPTVRVDEVQAVGSASVRGGDRVVDLVDDQRHL
jgi:hypothetical protein